MLLKLAQLSKVLRQAARAGVVVFSMFVVSFVNAADLETGLDAYYDEDYKTAFQEWKPLAEQGEARSQYWLGQLYNNGLGVTQDLNQAFKWISLSADQGDRYGQLQLGTMYRFGRGVNENYKEAIKWYRLAAEQGHTLAQEFLNELLESKTTD